MAVVELSKGFIELALFGTHATPVEIKEMYQTAGGMYAVHIEGSDIPTGAVPVHGVTERHSNWGGSEHLRTTFKRVDT